MELKKIDIFRFLLKIIIIKLRDLLKLKKIF